MGESASIDISCSPHSAESFEDYDAYCATHASSVQGEWFNAANMGASSCSNWDKLLLKRRCAADVGGTLAKLVYCVTSPATSAPGSPSTRYSLCEASASETSISLDGYAAAETASTEDLDENYHPYSPVKSTGVYPHSMKGQLQRLNIRVSPMKILSFAYFHSKNIEEMIQFLVENDLVETAEVLNVTGGGAYKYAEKFNDLRIQLRKRDEMASIMKGLHFLLSLPYSIFRYDITLKQRIPVTLTLPIYPFLVVNIGSGVSILKAKAPDDFTRVTGTCVGGGTVLGLARLIFGAQSFHEVVTLSEKGEATLDLTVADILGDGNESHTMPPDTLASSFGRVYYMKHEKKGSELRKSLRKADIARSLIHMVSYNIGYLAYLVGTIHNVRRIFFAGKYIDNHAFTMESITHGVNFYTTQYSHRANLANQTDAAMYERIVSKDQRKPVAHDSGRVIDSSAEASASFPDFARTKDSSDATESVNDTLEEHTDVMDPNMFFPAENKNQKAVPVEDRPFEVLFLRHDGYLGALGSLLAADD